MKKLISIDYVSNQSGFIINDPKGDPASDFEIPPELGMAHVKAQATLHRLNNILYTRYAMRNCSEYINEGEENFYWAYNEATNENNLQCGTLYLCECCTRPSSVNGAWLINATGNVMLKARAQADKIGLKVKELQLLIDDETGDELNLCEDCYPHEAERLAKKLPKLF